jgi:hypothetical protein
MYVHAQHHGNGFDRRKFKQAPRTDESTERLADASVAPSRSLPFLLSVLGGLEAWWLGGFVLKIRQKTRPQPK